MAKKPVKVVIPDEVLSRFPEEERPAMRAHLEEMFKSRHTSTPFGRTRTGRPGGLSGSKSCDETFEGAPLN